MKKSKKKTSNKEIKYCGIQYNGITWYWDNPADFAEAYPGIIQMIGVMEEKKNEQ